VKDIIETKGLLTEYGSRVYKGRIATTDAAIVRDLRQRGAIVLGKTQAAAFAWRTPPPTHNPHDLTHTPGGSSSGSAAAVAANMVPVTIGTQTAGSVLRPASYCGVAGFKGTHGLLSLDGVLEFSKSCDTLGFFTHTAADMLAFWEAIGQPVAAPDTTAFIALDRLPAAVEPAMATVYQAAIARLRSAGLSIKTIDIATLFTDLNQHQRTIMFYEGARFHEARYKQYGDRLDAVADLVRDGLKITTDQYNGALHQIAEGRTRIAAICRDTPIILSPAATGPAPLGLSDTGNAAMNGPWAAMGNPTISIPMQVGKALPLGLQIAADLGQDARVIRAGVLLEEKLGNSALV
jgi:Asp-tRNA(Asn)/Glu-tRNA(Gln) amidotransferase A subunit family amidase